MKTNNSVNIKQERNYSVDICKLILSIFVVLIHAEVNLGLFTPFLRTAVPLFFITSSFFFFSKIELKNNKRKILWNFIKRNMILYGCWFVILLPITLFIRDWFKDGMALGIVKFTQSFLFNSTFRASWYLMALNIGMCICLYISQKITAKLQLIITLPIYLICCLFTNYYGIAEMYNELMLGYDMYIFVFRSLANSFPVSLFWISIGRLFVEHKKQKMDLTTSSLCFAIIISSIMLVIEHMLVSYFCIQKSNDCYVMLIPLCYYWFELIVNKRIFGEKTKPNPVVYRFGNISTIIYVSHASIITLLSFIFKRIPLISNFVEVHWLIFMLTVIICIGMCIIVFRLEHSRYFKWLKFLY